MPWNNARIVLQPFKPTVALHDTKGVCCKPWTLIWRHERRLWGEEQWPYSFPSWALGTVSNSIVPRNIFEFHSRRNWLIQSKRDQAWIGKLRCSDSEDTVTPCRLISPGNLILLCKFTDAGSDLSDIWKTGFWRIRTSEISVSSHKLITMIGLSWKLEDTGWEAR